MKIKSLHGFTLIEISIVLVIIALLVAGIVAGKTMIENAKRNRISAQATQITTAVKAFQLKYGALPGDFTAATNFWGTDTGCPNTTGNSIPKTVTCNGNGDGKLSSLWSTNSASARPAERFRFWQHLANAELINGNFSGTTSSSAAIGNVDATPGINAPSVESDPASIFFVSYVETAVTWSGFGPVNGWLGSATAEFGNLLMFGIPPGSVNTYYVDNTLASLKGSFTTQEALQYDTKFDDGLPGTGAIRARYQDLGYNTSWAPCVNPADAATGRYYTSAASNACSMYYVRVF